MVIKMNKVQEFFDPIIAKLSCMLSEDGLFFVDENGCIFHKTTKDVMIKFYFNYLKEKNVTESEVKKLLKVPKEIPVKFSIYNLSTADDYPIFSIGYSIQKDKKVTFCGNIIQFMPMYFYSSEKELSYIKKLFVSNNKEDKFETLLKNKVFRKRIVN